MPKTGYVYIMTNDNITVLYTGKRYNVTKLVYYEVCEDIVAAIAREKQIKGGSRQKKVDLVASKNPEWRDLYQEL